MEFGVASGPPNRASIIDRVSGSKELRLRAGLDDDPHHVIPENLGRPRLVVASAPLCVDWIDRHRLDLDEKVLAGGARAVDLDIDKRPRVFDRKRLQISDGAHDSLPVLRSRLARS